AVKGTRGAPQGGVDCWARDFIFAPGDGRHGRPRRSSHIQTTAPGGSGRRPCPGGGLFSLEATSFTICAPMFLELVGEIDLLCDRHAVLGDGGGTPGLLEHHVAAAGDRASP